MRIKRFFDRMSPEGFVEPTPNPELPWTERVAGEVRPVGWTAEMELPRFSLDVAQERLREVSTTKQPPFLTMSIASVVLFFLLMLMASPLAPNSSLMLAAMSLGTGLLLALLGAAIYRKLA